MPPANGEKKSRRSRTGCNNCRRIHRKCDEAKPVCTGCAASGKQCVYGLRLSWGGRPFAKSSFGNCLETAVAVVHAESSRCIPDAGQSRRMTDFTEEENGNGFVYGLVERHHRIGRDEIGCRDSSHLSPVSLPSPPVASLTTISQNPSHLSQLSSSHRLLLDHFSKCVTRSFSLHLASHHGFCMAYLPLALDPDTGNSVLPAVLEAAALHRKSLGLYHNERQLIALRHASIRQFKLPTIGKHSADDDKAIATALILCLCDILAGGEKANSWQLHLQGAITMLRHASDGGTNNQSVSQESDLRKFLRRWCESLEVLSILGVDSKLTGQTVESNNLEYIDEFHGFCRKLIPIIQEVHLLLAERKSLQEMQELVGESHSMVDGLSYVIEERCKVAINDVKSLLAQTSHTFHPCVQNYMSPQLQSEFVSLNRAFHHGILLHIYRRVQDLPLTDPNIEASVEEIILHLSELNLRDEACPGVAMLQPLFDAGRYGMGNVSRSRAFLEEYWMEFDQQHSQGVDLHWDAYMKFKGWELTLY
ncbi:Adhesion and hyphal regulator 1 [Talaromyces islandicus]|uniref:Adhesion and hyphal regulator 1 n=1 Tax=Talaromyces islandicus TaxID=28573 RepID=A0A0U1M579_TALIS|nr:Adhesion and hyphal regulator 1 [Talaromyces islandicus]